jgi:type IV secretory pathway VirJ component
MIRTRLRALALALSALVVPTAGGAQPTRVDHSPPAETLKVPTFGTVTIYRGAAAPQQVVIFISGDGGWNLGVVDMATRLRDAGALVVGVDIRAFMKSLEASARCAYPAGSLEELSRAVQQRFALPTYIRPILVGYSSGATLVYAALAAAPPETFAGAISLGFCADVEIHRPLCQMRGLKAVRRSKGVGYDLSPFATSAVPWMVLQGESDQVCAPDATRRFVGETGATRLFSLPRVGHGFGVPGRWASQFLEAYRAIAATRVAKAAASRASAPAVADLSLVEVSVRAGTSNRTMAIVLTGDGGWADIDRSIAAGLVAKGIPVVGWSSLDYYWTPRTPEGAAHDLARIIEHYQSAWHAEHVLVIGYSFGADVAPLLVNRLPPGPKARVQQVALLGPSDDATLEFHVLEWLGKRAAPTHPTAPEIARLRLPVTCVFAEDEADSVCRTSTASGMRAVAIGRGHHFGGEYGRIVEAILR